MILAGLKNSLKVIQQWLEENTSNPYPSKETEEYLSKKANLTPKQVKTWFANTRRRLRHTHERAERLHLLRKKYKRRKENKNCRKTLSCPSLRSDGESSQDCMIIKEPSEKEDSSVLLIDQDKEYLADSTISMSSDSEVISRQSPDNLFTSPCNHEEERNARPRSSFNNSYENSTCKQATRGLTAIPPFQLVEPPVIANPYLFWPTLLTCCHDNYSDSAVNLQCTSMGSVNKPCSKPPSYSQEFDRNHRNIADILPWRLLPVFPVRSVPYQQNVSSNNQDVSSDHRYGSNMSCPLGLCLIPSPVLSPGSSGQFMRLHAASALLDLSLKSRMPGK